MKVRGAMQTDSSAQPSVFLPSRNAAVAGVLVLCLAAVLLWWQPLDVGGWFDRAGETAGHPLTIALMVVVQALFIAFALPATAVLWVVAPFHSPLVATLILLAGSLPGVLGAYLLARRLGSDWRPRRAAWVMQVMARRSDFLSQCALRILPGYPHWAVNYTSGVLALPLKTFMAAAVVGLTVKWGAYSAIIHATTLALTDTEALPVKSLLPLVLLAAGLIGASVWLQRRNNRREAG